MPAPCDIPYVGDNDGYTASHCLEKSLGNPFSDGRKDEKATLVKVLTTLRLTQCAGKGDILLQPHALDLLLALTPHGAVSDTQ